MPRKLPPLNALRAFEAAARHLSFSKAADELNVTPAAVSQQVKSLEAHAGTTLFKRMTRELRLTDSGQCALPLISEALDLMADGFQRMSEAERSGVITISVPPSFGAKWLVPRVEKFRRIHPQFELRIDPTPRIVDLLRDDVDVALRYGRGDYPGLVAERMMSERSFPVCAPELLQGETPLRRPEDLARVTLLHTNLMAPQPVDLPDWTMWLRAAGLTDVDGEKGPRFGHGAMALEAAIQGQGVALVSDALVADDLARGRLVRLFPETEGLPTDFRYWLVYPKERADTPKIQAFRAWVMAEAKESEKALNPDG